MHAGLGRYTRELVTHLTRQSANSRYALIVRSKDESWLERIARSTHVDIVEADIPHYSLAEQIALPRLLRSLRPALFFSPHFNAPFFCPVPCAITVHDLILHRYPNAASPLKQAAYRSLMRRAVARAKGIIAVSAFTQRELIETFGASIGAKTHVIREGVDPAYRPTSAEEQQHVRDRFSLTRPYFLYVGNAKQHKNVDTLLKAYEMSGIEDTELVLVTGGIEATSLVLPKGARMLSAVPDESLPALYGAARCFVTASLYEGFGLPVAEALACGCPVIATNRSAIPEVAQGHARLIEPTVSAFAQALRSPPKPAAPFVTGTWEAAAESTAELLNRLI